MNDKLEKEIKQIEEKINELPAGYISKKKINGKVQFYQQWTEDKKKKSKYISETAVKELEKQIIERRKLQARLKELKAQLPKNVATKKEIPSFQTNVIVKDRLKSYASLIAKYKKRECFSKLNDYLYNDEFGKVFILYGLRRTGKTTMIRQAINSMSTKDFQKTAFIQIRTGNNLAQVNEDLKLLQEDGYKYIFLDEVTLMDDFIEGAALFSDIFSSSGMKIILSGTDSLGFLFSESDQLYDRAILLHTTFISYREFEKVLGIKGIDEYISYGGTMSLGGIHYNDESTFHSLNSTDEYIDSAIAKNIQHSLKCYEYEGHFRNLKELYDNNELTNVINRIVEDINHRFTLEVLTKDFQSNDLSISQKNLRKDKTNPTNVLDLIDKESLLNRLKEKLEIKNKDEQNISIKDIHRREIKEYFDLLDLTMEIELQTIPVSDEKQTRTVFTQPGIRYCQAKTLVSELLDDSAFQALSIDERTSVTERILEEIKGRMMEDIVLLETKLSKKDCDVFKLQFAIGEFDMVVADKKMRTCKIYEIKHSEERVPQQYKNLIDEKKCNDTILRYGTITEKIVLYRGKTCKDNEITYQNVEEYLKSLS